MKNRNHVLNYLSVIVYGVFLVMNFVGTQHELTDIMTANATDHLYIEHIHERINQYEAETGTEIINVGFLYDQSVTYKNYPILQTAYIGELACRCIVPTWAQIQILNYYTGRQFNKISTEQIPEDIRMYVEGTNWTSENLDQQLIFRGNELFIALY